jgi:hypothetical protein|uniref:Uncharacterized protein n=1 Tax=Leviviridae sp. TaxID=2027243 RepID=A0A514CZ10_9VIRU|nr:MAG: hypothetical protein H2RhizoLitter49761_000004 [Leviviridae sp.]
MALTDPQSITIGGTTSPLPRTFSEGNESAYTSADGLWKLSLNHSPVKQGRTRHLLRFDHAKIAANPLEAGENVRVNMAVYTVFDVPPPGFYTSAEILAVYTGFKSLYSASSDAVITKLIGGES